jgi:diaminopimelate decarboxylase
MKGSVKPIGRRGGVLWIEDVAMSGVAGVYGTPCYVYSARSFRERYRFVKELFARELSPLGPWIAYSVKACSNLGILSILAAEGACFDVVSGGELLRVLRAGAPASRVIFAGVGKTDDELALALDAGVFQIHVESRGELVRLDRLAAQSNKKARVALRVNPAVRVDTHKHLTTGARGSKFGIPFVDAAEILKNTAAFRSIQFAGLHVHVGSMLESPSPYVEALERLQPLVELFAPGSLETIDLGGGFAVERAGRGGHEARPALELSELVRAVAPRLRSLGAIPVFEPGRWIAAPSGVLLTRILDCKNVGERRIVIVDAAMNDLIRPALYDAVHPVEPVAAPSAGAPAVFDIYGPVCESGDYLARDVELHDPKPGDLLAILDAGAYGFSMSSNYNSRGRAPEVVIDGAKVRLVRRRETPDDLMALEFTA